MTEVRFTHIGGPTVLIEFEGWRLLTDPTFDPPGRTYAFGWGTSSRKLTGPAVAAAGLGAIDAVLLTHVHHGDNLDDAGRALLPAAGTVVTTRSGAPSLPVPARGLRAGQATRLEAPGRPPIDVLATPCRHGPPLSRPIVGEVIGFALTWPGQAHGPLWITGDTVYHRALRRTAAGIRPGTVLLHLGGVGFPLTGPLRYTMTARQAVRLCEAIAPRTVLPVHYEGWQHFRQGRDGIERELRRAPERVGGLFRWLPAGTAEQVRL
ncbi:L-ascorbate metabolism protein UlaG, beta-lactamase superfamily [Nonomuraea solani]|uniref:L-ascorbate metabolism protein UlaG, beta-lactamase superfamily n=1 Tax=Nonomuraea solani TaxID=1144553 RepID=A0A1H6EWN8_9ACTN|nr:MBL fold metallo-hydrolase [Nonomuraea solani]SEH01084.1 L-ascorbate metabolism protein UlaG, beta-lactamase superfamily [Nonomuraea solani]